MITDAQKEIFREEASELLTELEASLLELEETPGNEEQIGRVFRALHTIKGSGAMSGFDEVASFAHELESFFDRVRSGEIKVTSDLVSFTLAGCDHIRAMLREAYGGEPAIPQRASDIIGYLKSLFPEKNNCYTHSENRNKEDKANLGEFRTRTEHTTYRIFFQPHRDIFHNGTNPLLLLNELRQLGECGVFALTQNIPVLMQLDPEANYVGWDIILTTDKNINAIRDVFIFVEDSSDISIDLIHDDIVEERHYKRLGEILVERGKITPEVLNEVLKKQKKIGDLLVEEKVVDPVIVEAALAEQQHVREVSKQRWELEKSSGIRVDSEKLDRLANLVGELVTLQARFFQLANSSEHPDMLAVAEEMERLTSELRDNTMNIRMVPIGKTFGRFRRLVRDLSAELNKQVRFSVEGEDTELDKTIAEQLHDPIIHILRNAIDHGIEAPEIRNASGKPEYGTILMSASYSGAGVRIRISDDGAGLNSEKIRATAIEKGLISPNSELSEKDIHSLICMPGFSTASSVTGISGRGVGMDVVRRRIEELRGSLDIESRLGFGTVFSLTLPLTLAMIDGLLVRVGEEYYVFPLSSVEECIEADMTDKSGQHIINIRNEIVPYIFLREIFNIEGDAPNIGEIIITRSEGTRVGFVADQIIGQHQTVIRSLGRYCRKAKEFSGATVLADGTVALIADISKLIETAKNDLLRIHATKTLQAEA